MHGVIMVKGIVEVFFELGKEAGGYEGCRGCVDAGFALEGESVRVMVEEEEEGGLAWPPEKPTATTPRSLFELRNFGAIVEGEVIVGVNESKVVDERLDDLGLTVPNCFSRRKSVSMEIRNSLEI